MKDFLLNNHSFIRYFVEILAAVTGLFYYKKYKVTAVRYFIWFLVYVVIIELIGGYPRYVRDYPFLSSIEAILKDTKFERNFWWFTFFWNIASAVFYSFYFRKVIKSNKFISIIKYSTLLFVACSIIYIGLYWDAFFVSSLSFINIFGTSIILMSIMFYFIEILQSDKILSFHKSINFIISAVLLIWFLIITPLVFYQMYYSTADWIFVFSRRMIYLFTNIFMYSSFTIALIWCKPQNV